MKGGGEGDYGVEENARRGASFPFQVGDTPFDDGPGIHGSERVTEGKTQLTLFLSFDAHCRPFANLGRKSATDFPETVPRLGCRSPNGRLTI